ncbi:MmcQ/YjbR family DNA-binding protein [Eubacterium sp. 1001713B170207_170306_E7]|uniref:MmcQ/YjbR family DNA-binding protein n=1 Tax=Eubacterium sp. 1001713B170207_170306_E7 TaxID=2787097 RepID=UPI00189808B3|nr:MmcQ/YjbR family DNA-binding protein [Eubacterium sp. 1001713B170207_170306_E7]
MDKYPWIDACFLEKKGVEKAWQAEWEAMKYLLHGKMFAFMGTHKTGDPILTLKLPPEEGLALRAAYPGAIIPGYYMNKVHWNTLYLERDVPEDTVRKMLDSAYETILKSLPKKVQREIEEVS